MLHAGVKRGGRERIVEGSCDGMDFVAFLAQQGGTV